MSGRRKMRLHRIIGIKLLLLVMQSRYRSFFSPESLLLSLPETPSDRCFSSFLEILQGKKGANLVIAKVMSILCPPCVYLVHTPDEPSQTPDPGSLVDEVVHATQEELAAEAIRPAEKGAKKL